MSSINLQQGSSTGLPLKPYEELLDLHKQLLIDLPGFSFKATANSPLEEISLKLEEGGETGLKRVLGCILISVMPEKGLEETLVTLKDIFQFYIEKLGAPPALTPPSHVMGIVGNAQKRPGLTIEE